MIFAKRAVFLFFLVLAVMSMSAALIAQAPASVKGSVLDPSGAAVPGATVTLTGPNGVVKVAQSDSNGVFTAVGLPPGKWTVRVIAAGFDLFEGTIENLPGGRASSFDAKLVVASEKQEVTVKDVQQVELDPAKNAGALVLKEADLDMLSDDPDDLQADLMALAGPAAGPNGGQIFIDGFSSGQLPPKDSIREIRINSNPYSAEFDTQGHGRIEIFTKPGSDKFHGSINAIYTDHIWNARNPYNTQTSGLPASDTKNLMATLSGPINKKASFFLDFSRRQLREAALVNQQLLDPTTYAILPLQSFGIIAPTTNTRISPRVNYQLTSKITLDARYVYSKSETDNQGVGGFNQPSTGATQHGTNQQFFLTETAVLNSTTINESRFQYFRNDSHSTGNDPVLNISVASAFTEGSNFETGYSNSGNYEFQNYTSITHGTQFIKFGGRLRETRLSNYNTNNFLGQFNFSNIQTYQLMEAGIAAGLPLSAIIANGGGPIQYQVAAGEPLIAGNQFDAGLFFQDDWKLIPSMTLSLGLRYEVQTNINDHGDVAPRIGWAWGLGGGTGRFRQPKTVIRAGSGYFYDRFSLSNTLNAERFNGVNQVSYIVTNPTFYPAAGVPIPPVSTLPLAGSTVYHVDSDLHVPTQLQSAVGIDRQLPHNVSVSFNYLNTRGTHTLLPYNMNAPYPGTYIPPSPGVPAQGEYPFGQAAGIQQLYGANGVYRQNQLIFNSNARINSKISLFGYYVYGHVKTDANGAPSNPYNFAQDYGRASYDIRHQANINGSILAPWGIRFSPNIGLRSAPPFNIVEGIDTNGDSVVNDRPAFLPSGASIPACAGRVVAGAAPCVSHGFVVNPTQGMTIIPVNYGIAHSQVNVNVRVSRTWGFGELTQAARNRQQQDQAGGGRGPGFGQAAGGRPGGGGGRGGGPGGPGGGMGMGGGDSSGRRYSLTASVMFHNLFNTVNEGIPVGSLNSPLFGQSTSLASGGFGGGGQAFNRRIDMSLRFSF
ncbi:MAG TPA: carboxypeptidase regulatory-like domain-containing protein [Bryobacteraceae bacterium]|nr:carboxypeptidase regulatory-like domain-containing protein [Bryobacteraceae bacterium]